MNNKKSSYKKNRNVRLRNNNNYNSEDFLSKRIYIISGDIIKKQNNNKNKEENISFYTPNKNNRNNDNLPFLKSVNYTLKTEKSKIISFENYYTISNFNKNSISDFSLSKIKYKVNKLLKPKLLKNPLKTLINTIEEEKKKIENEKIQIEKNRIKNPFLFRKLIPVNLTYLLEEEKDTIEDLNINKMIWYKNIRKALINDINNKNTKKNIFYKKFYSTLENRINFFFDVCLFPHLTNNLMFKKIKFDDDNYQNKNKLCNYNLLSKEIEISLNRRRIKLIFEEEEEKLLFHNRKFKKQNFDNQSLENKFELIDFFNKKNDVGKVDFASQKNREYVFNQKIKNYILYLFD